MQKYITYRSVLVYGELLNCIMVQKVDVYLLFFIYRIAKHR
jgi:hypothetical protein